MGDRDEILKSLGFNLYAEYLKSDMWKKIRSKVYALKGHVCCCCGKPSKHIHHTSYSIKTLTGDTDALIASAHPVCAKCHKSVHFKPDGTFRLPAGSRTSFNVRHKRAKEKVAKNRGRKIGKRRKLLEAMEDDKAFHDRMCGG
jgi:5-methylcytosine-specific restriction endonuclease McrA